MLSQKTNVTNVPPAVLYEKFTPSRSLRLQGFDTVLIDEAAQAVEMSTLIPLKYACRRLILVGDPNQLPATVFSDHAQKSNYEQSLFQRLQSKQAIISSTLSDVALPTVRLHHTSRSWWTACGYAYNAIPHASGDIPLSRAPLL